MGKRRADALLVEQGLVGSREKARVVIMAGSVMSANQLVSKPESLVDESVELRILVANRYVGRGGNKLEDALHSFSLSVDGLVALDVGASTGGFTDCLLQHGAAKVYAVDVGYGQLAYKLRQEPRVVSMERTNIRHLSSLPEAPDIATIDVSFISLETVLPTIVSLLKPGAPVIALMKPQFQARKQEVEKGGVVRDPILHATIVGRFTNWAVKNNYSLRGPTTSCLRGPAGNLEFFFLLYAQNAREE